MAGLKKLAGAYMIVLAVVVAVYFIINTVLGESIDDFDVQSVWSVVDVLMLIGLVLALVFNYARKREEDGGGPAGPSPAGTSRSTWPSTSPPPSRFCSCTTGSRCWPSAETVWTATIRPGSSGRSWT